MKEMLLVSFFAACICFPPSSAKTVSAAESYEGYTLFASGNYTYLVDMSGNEVHSWKAGGSVVGNSYLLKDGSVLVPVNNRCQVRHDGSLPSGRFQVVSWEGEITWDFSFCHETYTPGYDVEVLPNGNFLIAADNSSVAGAIFEIQPSGKDGGNVVWQYVLPDSLNQRGTYVNSVSYNPALDMILVDLQTPSNKLVVIDHSGSGRVVFTYTVESAESTGFGGPRLHAANWVSKYYYGTDILLPDADTIAMRVNNLLVVQNPTRVVEVNMSTGSLVKTIAYSFVNNEGSVQRLPNGNTLVQKGLFQNTIAELDDNGSTVVTLIAKGRCGRAYRYGYSHPGLSRLSTFVQKPVLIGKSKVEGFFDAGANFYRILLKGKNDESFTYSIISLAGETMVASKSTGNMAVINTGRLSAGLYYVDINAASQIFKTSFVKVR